jgi:hypothetical protein
MNDYTAFASEKLTVPSGNVAASFTRIKYDPSGNHLPVRLARFTVVPGAPVVFTIDGTTVSSRTGHALTAYGSYDVDGFDNIKNFRTTSFSSGTAGAIWVTYYR